LEANPALAFNTWFQKSTGLSLQELVAKANLGTQAALDLQAEAVNKEFITSNPGYYPDPDYQNFASLVRWIAKYKLGKTATDKNAQAVFNDLVSSGKWTVENLEEAYQDLSEDGLLVKAPKPPKTPPPVEVQTTEPAPPAPRPEERIVRTETRPRAALGIRTSDVTPAPPPAPEQAPSAEDFDSMTDEQITNLMKQIRRNAIQNRRS
jgi:hypothetical protein